MDTTTAAVIVIVVFALVGIAAFLLFRRRGSAEFTGPFGTGLKVEGSNESSSSAGIQAKGVKSRKGGVLADDATGRGVAVEDVVAETDIKLSSKAPERSDTPKTQPPS